MSKIFMKRGILHILIILFFLPVSAAYSQENDTLIYSLLTDLQMAKSDTIKMQTFIKLAYAYYPQDAKTAIKKANLGLLLADKYNNINTQIDAYDILIRCYAYAKHDLPSAMEYLRKAKALDSTFINIPQKALILEHEGKISLELNDYKKAQTSFFRELKLHTAADNKVGIARVNYDLGTLYFNIYDFKSAIDFYSKALQGYYTTNNVKGKIESLNAIGKTYIELKNFDKALKYCTDALYLAEAFKDEILLSNININLGIANSHLGFLEDAMECFNNALLTGEINNNLWLVSTASNEIGKIYSIEKDLKKAESFFNQSLIAAQQCNDKFLLKNIYSSLLDFYEKQGKQVLAYEYLKKYTSIKDSLITEEKSNLLIKEQIRFQNDKKEEEYKQMQIQFSQNQYLLQTQKYQNYALILSVMALLGVSFGLFKAFQKKQLDHQELEVEVQKRTNQLHESYEELINSNNRLEQSNNELERFAYIASHDLKSPLRNIISFLGLIKRKLKNNEDKELLEYLNFATDNAKQMHSLIQDVLEFSKIDNEKEANYTNIDLNESLALVVQNLQDSMQSKKAVIVAEALPVVKVNSVYMIQLFQNLIGNGIKYNESKNPQIAISYSKEEHNHQFIIKDNGIGIAPEFHEQIFQMFKRLHTKDKYSGTGIGLAICQKIINNMGGKIWLDSRPGNGTTFYFTIPAA